MWKRLTREGEIVENSSISLSLTLDRNEEVEYHIRMKTHKLITLKLLVEINVNLLCG